MKVKTDSDEELEYHLMMTKKQNDDKGNKKVNPFMSRIGNQEVQASQLS
jgi:hypothetical protein